MPFCNCTFVCNALNTSYITVYTVIFSGLKKNAIAIFAIEIAVASQFVHEMRVSTKVFTQAFYSIEKMNCQKSGWQNWKKSFQLNEWPYVICQLFCYCEFLHVLINECRAHDNKC